MKTITIDDELYAHIAAQTKYIGEGASDILRRLLLPDAAELASDNKLANTEATPEVEIPKEETQTTGSQTPDAMLPGELSLDGNAILACSTVVERFLLVLSALNAANPTSFSKVLEIKGKGRDYFAISKQHLLATGSSTNPKAIPDSEYWVVSNNNTSKKASILRQVSEVLGYDEKTQQDITQSLTLKN